MFFEPPLQQLPAPSCSRNEEKKKKKNGKKKKLQPAPCLAQPVAAVLTKSARTAASSPCSDSSPTSPLRRAASTVLPSLHPAQAAPTTTPQQPAPFAAKENKKKKEKIIKIEENKWSWPKEDEECNEEEEK
jgi:PPE-repeat protein